jgi:hypothetical protein
MSVFLIIKAGFIGFILALGPLILVFYLFGAYLGLPERKFTRLFLIAAIVSFGLMYWLLQSKMAGPGQPMAPTYFSGVVGGWLGGLAAGATTIKPVLIRLARGGRE